MSEKNTNKISIRENLIAGVLTALGMIVLAKLLPMTGMKEDMSSTLCLVLPILAYTSWVSRRRGKKSGC